MRRLLLLALLTSGCGFHWSVVDPSSEKEALCLSETGRYAKLMGYDVRGEIADRLSPAQVEAVSKVGTPTAWYEAGVAYYYRPKIKDLAIEPTGGMETISNVAAHEVCHARYPQHDLAHWDCMAKWAQPTYPRP